MKKKIGIVLLEDNPALRKGIKALLERSVDFRVLAAPGIHDGSVTLLRRLKPRVILLDLGLRGHNTLHMVESIRREMPRSAVIVMDLAPASGDVVRFIRAGASGFILKDAPPDEFYSTIYEVAEGRKVLPPLLSGSVFSQIVDLAHRGQGAGVKEAMKMTRREQEVLALIADGLTNKEIAKTLKITPYTVKSHIHNIMEKLTLHTRLEVANYALTGRNLTRRV